MSAGPVAFPFGQEEAERLLKAGWTQGSVFRPNEYIDVPERLRRDDFYLVVCTQACTIVSSSLAKDPIMEVAVATPVATYSPKSEAATGKLVRAHHLPVAGAAFQALEVDINARFIVPRERLLRFAPDGPQASDGACRALAGWIGRYYTRIAIPNELVERLKGRVFAPLAKFLKASPKGSTAKHHEDVHSIFMRWQPTTEIGPEERYKVDFLFLCDEPSVADALGAKLEEIGLDPSERAEKPGLSVHCSVQARSETVLTELDGWTRLTEWDHLTDLGDVVEMLTG